MSFATRDTRGGVAYGVEVIGNVTPGWDCVASLNGDPCRKKAVVCPLTGVLDLPTERGT
jgi:hypothetical protein